MRGFPRVFRQDVVESVEEPLHAHSEGAHGVTRGLAEFAARSGLSVYDGVAAGAREGVVPAGDSREQGRLLPRGMPGSRFR